MQAAADGYYREAVMSAASSLERFREYAVRVFARHRKIPLKTADAAWKPLANASERQLGMFAGLYLLEIGEQAPLVPDLMTLRNRVVHQGHIPTKDEAVEYLQKVADHIIDVLAVIYVGHRDSALLEALHSGRKRMTIDVQPPSLIFWLYSTPVPRVNVAQQVARRQVR